MFPIIVFQKNSITAVLTMRVITWDTGVSKPKICVYLFLYDISGRLITTLINEFRIAGYHSIKWDASNFSSGIYFLNMSSRKISETKKLVLIK